MAYQRTLAEQKYDRQMRLWGSHGQMRLETAHICLIGSGATASETLKNLVLPNVGRFTLIDDHLTTTADKSSNFFVDLPSIGRPRAEAVRDLMLEMNSEVKGEAVVKNAREMLAQEDLSYFAQFSCVIVAEPTLPVKAVLPLASFLYERGIPLVHVQTKGLLGTARLQVKEHCIIESHPGNDRYDLYAHPEQTKHWPELAAYAKKFKVYKSDYADEAAAKADGEEHAHIPYLAILIQEIARWQAEKGSMPSTWEQNKAFKAFVRASSWSAEEGNFDEAIDFAHRAYELPKFDRGVQEVFDDAAVTDVTRLKASPFWCMVRAVKEFISHEGHGVCYPVSQNLPDMHCKTEYYVELKEIFRVKAEKDFDAVKAHLNKLLNELGLPPTHVPEADLHMFVKNVRTLRVIRTSSLVDEYGTDGTSSAGAKFQKEYLQEILEEEVYEEEDDETDMNDAAPKKRRVHNPKNVHWYLGLRAADMFHAKHGRIPGTAVQGKEMMAALEADGAEMIELEKQLLANTGLDACVESPDIPVLAEVTRSAASEPHVTAAFMGGIAAQIVLKVLLQQYVPLNNTVLWNGLFASSNTYKL